jgi:hypothetical protein
LLATVAALADAAPDKRWREARRELQAMSDLVHESFAVGMSLLTTQRPIAPLADYPTYDRHVRTIERLIGPGVHPWVALAAFRAAATACMQSSALTLAASSLADFEPRTIATRERPNHRLASLLPDFANAVQREQQSAVTEHGHQSWWRPTSPLLLPPEAMDGTAAAASEVVHRRLFAAAAEIVADAGGVVVPPNAHHDDLLALLAAARTLAPAGLARIGALVESPGGELLRGGPLDGQIIELATAPKRATVLPYGSLSGASGEGDRRHVFVVLTTPRRLMSAHELEGVDLPPGESITCLRTTVFDGEKRDSILLLPVATPDELVEDLPVYVSAFSSAAAAEPDMSAAWMRFADRGRVSLIMDTPATAALHRWCRDGTTFRTETRMMRVENEEVRVIIGRLEEADRRSPLVIIPSTEFGARWFESARAEDPVLRETVIDEPGLFERESDHLDVVLTHLLFEERYLGTGSWRR